MSVIDRQQVLLRYSSIAHLISRKVLRFGNAPKTVTWESLTARITSLLVYLPMGQQTSPMAFQLVHMSITTGHPSVGENVLSLLQR